MEQLVTACLELGDVDEQFIKGAMDGAIFFFFFSHFQQLDTCSVQPQQTDPNADGHRGLCNFAPNLDHRPSSEDPGNYAWVSHGSPLGATWLTA